MSAFPESLIADGFGAHPEAPGYQLMGKILFHAIESITSDQTSRVVDNAYYRRNVSFRRAAATRAVYSIAGKRVGAAAKTNGRCVYIMQSGRSAPKRWWKEDSAGNRGS